MTPKKESRKFAFLVAALQVAFIVVYAVFVEYDEEADSTRVKRPEIIGDGEMYPQDNILHTYYPMFQDIHGMIFFGVGFLYTFLRKYAYSGVGMTMLLATVSIQLAIILQNCWEMTGGKIKISIVSLIMGEFAAASAVIALGGVFGKISPLQMVVFVLLEVASYTTNEHLCVTTFQIADLGGSVSLHLFAAIFGLAVAYIADKDLEVQENSNESNSYESNLFCMIGTVFLWALWPSFNSSLALGDARYRSVINTYLALLASCATAFVTSSFISKNNKFTMSHIQNSTLAGGVAIGAVTDMMIQPVGALIIGGLAGAVSVIGFKYVSPFLAKLRIYDPCGINSLHAIPGFLAGLSSIVVALIATEDNHGYSIYKLYPAMAPSENTTDLYVVQKNIAGVEAGTNRTPQIQAAFQLLYIVVCIVAATITGLITGLILRLKVFAPLEKKHMYLDDVFWEVPQDAEKRNFSSQVTETKF